MWNEGEVTITIDPMMKYTKVPPKLLVDACGILPRWATNSQFKEHTLKEAMEMQYGFPMMCFGAPAFVRENGEYTYPGDPVMYPYMKITRADEVFYIYENAQVAFCGWDADGNWKYETSRMD